jgi:hypothetical protein
MLPLNSNIYIPLTVKISMEKRIPIVDSRLEELPLTDGDRALYLAMVETDLANAWRGLPTNAVVYAVNTIFLQYSTKISKETN